MAKWIVNFSIRRKTGENTEPGQEEAFYNRVHVTLKGSSDDDLAYVVRTLKELDGKEWE